MLGHLDGLDDREPTDDELVGRQHGQEGGGIQDSRAQALPERLGERRGLTHHVHVEKAPVDEEFEIPVEARVRVLHAGHPGILDADIDAVHPEQDERIGVEHADVDEDIGVDVHSPQDEAVASGQEAREAGRGEEGAQPERKQGRGIAVVLGRGREDRDHERAEQIVVGPDGGQIGDGTGELGRPGDLVEHGPGHRGQHRAAFGELVLPVSDEGSQAELRAKWKLVDSGGDGDLGALGHVKLTHGGV